LDGKGDSVVLALKLIRRGSPDGGIKGDVARSALSRPDWM
jgi:hypothetical protein